MKRKCPECDGEGRIECGHDSHWIDSMLACTDPNCCDGWVDCEMCDGLGEIDDQTGKENQNERITEAI